MKTFKLTKGVQIILITLLVIVVGAIIVGLVSNDKSMAASYNDPCTMTSGCNGKLTVISQYDATRHQVACGVCGKVGAIINCSWSTSNPVAKPVGNDMHYWYSTCSMCGMVNSNHYSSGACSDGNGDEICDYCGGETTNTGGGGGSGDGGSGDDCTCSGGSDSYYKDYRYKDSDLHSCYFVCNDCGGEWYDADYIHEYSDYTDNGNGTHTSYCDKDCGGKITGTCNFVNGECTVCGAEEECNHIQETIPAIAATCTTAGKTEGKRCSLCGEILVQPTEVPAKGHTIVDVPAPANLSPETP